MHYSNGCARYAYRERMTRTRGQDACPGALQVHRAADGALARIRLPGGMIDPAQLEALAHAATRFGSPAMELTSRGNIQIRGIRGEKATLAVADAVAAAGLLPSPTHERVRNIVASPLSGRVGGHPDVRDWVHRLDAAIRAEPALASTARPVLVRHRRRPRRRLRSRLQTSVRTCPTNRSPYCWPAVTPVFESHRPTSCRP